VPPLFRKLGIPVLDNAGMADYVGILRKLWAGETVTYSGPAGNYPEMQLAQPCEATPPVILGAVGPKTLALAGAHFDGVVLHPFLSVAGVARSVAIVRDAAERAGRDPVAVRIYATVVTAPDTLSDAERANILEARAVSSNVQLRGRSPAMRPCEAAGSIASMSLSFSPLCFEQHCWN
jgi:5,10-methylenetetrahydromethanopterin reductase